MDSTKIPQAVANIENFMQELKKANPRLSQAPYLNQLLADWANIKEFTDAVFYPQRILSYAEKRKELEIEAEAQEEVDYLLFTLGITVKD